MAIDQRSTSKAAATEANERRKQAFVVLLGIALCVVLYIQFVPSNDESSQASPDAADVTQETPIPTVSDVPLAMTWSPSLTREYPSISLPSKTIEEIVLRQPIRAAAAKETRLASEAMTEPLIVSAIYATPKRSAAIVGTSIVRDGDKLPDGRRLVAASPRGLQTQIKASVSADDRQ